MKKKSSNNALVVLIIFTFMFNIVALAQASFTYEPIQELTIPSIETFFPTDDTYISHYDKNIVFGDSVEMLVRNEYDHMGGGRSLDILIRFDLSSLQQNETIRSAALNLYYCRYQHAPAYRLLNCSRVTSIWNESSVTWNTQPSYASLPTCNATVPVNPGHWVKWDVTHDVQGFLNGVYDNYGWRIIDDVYWGTVNLPITIFYSKEFGNFTPYLAIERDQAPDAPIISGPGLVKVNTSVPYDFSISDPDEDMVFLLVDWGDGMQSEWGGPYASGGVYHLSHAWAEQGNYEIKAKAKDMFGMESNWSDPFWVNVTNPALDIDMNGGVGVSIILRSTGDDTTTNISWSASLEGGFVIPGKTQSGSIDRIHAGNSRTVRIFMVGFGKIKVTVETLYNDAYYVEKTSDFFLIFMITFAIQ